MSLIPMFSSRGGKVYNLAGNVVSKQIDVCSIADYFKSIDVNLRNGTYVRFGEVGGVSYGCYLYQSGILYSAPGGNPQNFGNCQGVVAENPATINFTHISNKSLIDPPFALQATSNQPMPIYFTTTNSFAIGIIGNSGYIGGESDCAYVTAVQDPSGTYGGGSSTQYICVGLAEQIITTSDICNNTQEGYTYIDLRTHASSNRPGANIGFNLYDPGYASLQEDGYTCEFDNDLMLQDEVCTVAIQAYDFGGNGYSSANNVIYYRLNYNMCEGTCP